MRGDHHDADMRGMREEAEAARVSKGGVVVHNIEDVEKMLQAHRGEIQLLHERNRTEELLKIIRKPGWTTPAEFLMFTALVDQAAQLTHSLSVLHERMFEGAKAVTAKAE